MSKIISIIPARGGSKSIPKKNIIDINGKPLIYYSINASLESNIDETWVSTDCEDIAKVAMEFGAKVSLRSPELANDIIHPDDTVIDFIMNHECDYILFIQPTSPLIKAEYIDRAIEKIKEGYDSVFTVTEKHWIPDWREDVSPHDWEIKNRPRRQDRDILYSENGMFYLSKRETVLKEQLRYGGKMAFLEIPLHDSFQVDTYDDIKLIEKLL